MKNAKKAKRTIYHYGKKYYGKKTMPITYGDLEVETLATFRTKMLKRSTARGVYGHLRKIYPEDAAKAAAPKEETKTPEEVKS